MKLRRCVTLAPCCTGMQSFSRVLHLRKLDTACVATKPQHRHTWRVQTSGMTRLMGARRSLSQSLHSRSRSLTSTGTFTVHAPRPISTSSSIRAPPVYRTSTMPLMSESCAEHRRMHGWTRQHRGLLSGALRTSSRLPST